MPPNLDCVGFFDHVFSLLPDVGSYYLILERQIPLLVDPLLHNSSTNPGVVTKFAVYMQFLSDYSISDI